VPSTPLKTGEPATPSSLIASPSATSATGPAPLGPAAAAAATIAASAAAAATPSKQPLQPLQPVPRASSYVASPAKPGNLVAAGGARVRGSSAAPPIKNHLGSLEESPPPPPANGTGVTVATQKLHSLTSMSKRSANGPSLAGGPAGPLSPVGAYRTQAQVVVQPASASSQHLKQHPHGTPPQPHRSVSMPIQPADLRGLPSPPLSAAALNSGNSVATASLSPSESASATAASANTPLSSAVPPAPPAASAVPPSATSTSGSLPAGITASSLPLSTPSGVTANTKPPVGRPEHSRAFNVGEGLRRSLPLDGSFRSAGTRAGKDGAQKAARQLNQPMLAASSLPMSSYTMPNAVSAAAAATAPLGSTATAPATAPQVTQGLPSSRAHR